MNTITNFMLKNRLLFLVFFGLLGIVLAGILYYCLFPFMGLYNTESRIVSSIILIALGLPVAILLWFFRTHDTKQQINIAIFNNAVKLIIENQETEKIDGSTFLKNECRRAVVTGVRQLMYVRNELHSLTELIDKFTPGLRLFKYDFSKVNFSNANLTGAELTGTDLRGADLRGAKLIGADLLGADLLGAKLTGADLEGAKYNSNTTFPERFNPEKEGMIFVE